MRRLRLVAAVTACVAVLAVALPASASSESRVVVLWLDGTTFDDWAVPGLAGFEGVLRDGAIGLVSTRTFAEPEDVAGMRAAAAVTIGAAAHAAGEPGTGEPVEVAGVTPGLLGESLSRAGVPVEVLDTRAPDRATSAAFATLDGTRPPSRSGLLPGDARVILIDPGDTARAGSGAPAMRRAMVRTGRLIERVRARLGVEDTLMVLGATPSPFHRKAKIRLAPVAIVGDGFEPGLVSSGSTRRAGVVALIDVAPTILSILGVAPAGGLEGRTMRSEPRPGALTDLRRLASEVKHAANVRKRVTRHGFYAAMVAVVLAAAAVGAGVGRARGGRFPRGSRDALHAALVFAAALPLGMFVEGSFPTRTRVSGEVAIFAFALACSLGLRAVVGPSRALLTVLTASAAVPVADILLGFPLAHKSGLAFQISLGARFFGVDEAILGMVVGSALAAAALWLDRARDHRRAAIAIASGLAVVVVAVGAPSLGSKFGAPLTAVPAFGVLAVRAGGRRLGAWSILVIAGVTIAVTGLFVLADAARAGDAQTHVARAATGGTDITALVARKWRATIDITFVTMWSIATAVFGAAMGAIAWRRRDAFDRGMWGRPHLRAALVASGVGAVCAVTFNDAGVIASAPLLLYASVAMFATLVAGDDG